MQNKYKFSNALKGVESKDFLQHFKASDILEVDALIKTPVVIHSVNGNAVLMSEEEYNGLIETIYLSSSPEIKEKILKGLNTPLRDCVSEEDVEW